MVQKSASAVAHSILVKGGRRGRLLASRRVACLQMGVKVSLEAPASLKFVHAIKGVYVITEVYRLTRKAKKRGVGFLTPIQHARD